MPPPAEGGVETVSLEQSVPDTVGDDEELERPEEELRPLDEVELTPGLEDQVRAAWERLPHAAKNEPELNLLLELLGHDRELLALVGAMQGLKSGVLAVTDSRLLLVRGIVRAKHEEIPLSSVLSVSQVGERTIVLELAWGKPVKFENVRPSEETPAVVEAIRARLNGPAA